MKKEAEKGRFIVTAINGCARKAKQAEEYWFPDEQSAMNFISVTMRINPLIEELYLVKGVLHYKKVVTITQTLLT